MIDTKMMEGQMQGCIFMGYLVSLLWVNFRCLIRKFNYTNSKMVKHAQVIFHDPSCCV